MKGILFVILLVASISNSHASCFIQDINGNCIQQSQYSALQAVQQPQVAQQGITQQSNTCEGTLTTCADFIQRSKQEGLSIASTYNDNTKEAIYSAYSNGSTQTLDIRDSESSSYPQAQANQPAPPTSNNYSSGSGITLEGILITWLIVLGGSLGGMFSVRKEYLEKYNYEIFDWINIAILTGFIFLSWFVGFNLAFRLGLGTIWPGLIFTILIGVIIAFYRTNKQMGKKEEAVMALILQFMLSASAAFLLFLLYALFGKSDRKN